MQDQIRSTKTRTIVALSGVLMASACQGPGGSTTETSSSGGMTTGEAMPTSGEGSTTGGGSTGDVGPSEEARVTLQVVDGEGQAIEGALVEFGGASHSTGVAGLLDLSVAGDELGTRLVMHVSAAGYTASAAVFETVASGAEILHVVVLHALGEPVVVPSASGGVVERGGIRVEVPADAFVDSHGNPVQGDVEVTLVPLDPTLPGAMDELPGPLAAVRSDASTAELEPVIMAEISAWQGGQRLQLAPGKKAKMSFAVPASLQSTVSAGELIPAWFFDNEQGLWREEGVGNIESKDGALVWSVEVAHFTWWNCDKPWTDKNCYDVTVVNPKGDPVMNMLVTAQGVDYQGKHSKYTKANGHACVEGKLGGLVDFKAGLAPNFLALAEEVQAQGAVDQPGACQGPGQCIPVTLMLQDDCNPGEQEKCYTGDEKTEGVGLCKPGVKTQLGDCKWSPCLGEVLPKEEKCATKNVDEDCDGDAKNGCLCTPGAVELCWHSDPVTEMKQKENVGLCNGGERVCASDGHSWGPCEDMVPGEGQPIPAEVCGDGLDNDCNGGVDVGCECGPIGIKKACYPGNPQDLEAPSGICKAGSQTCGNEGWGTCEDPKLPKVEDCESAADEDCDGKSGCCGDGMVNGIEECDAEDENGFFGCSKECTKREVQQVVVGRAHACALLMGGKVKCWGENQWGQLGLGDTAARGDQPGEMGASLPEVDLGTNASVIAIAAGGHHTCALLDGGTVKCWGNGVALGLGNALNRGDGPGEMGDNLPAVDLGVKDVVAVTGGRYHTCATLGSGLLKCWGSNGSGQLGLGDTASRGDNPGEMGEALPFVDLGKDVEITDIATGWEYTCALFPDELIKCWGGNSAGQLGIGDKLHRGDQPGEMGGLPFVSLGANATVVSLDTGWDHSCVLLKDSRVKCWGCNFGGQLGLGSTTYKGGNPGEMGDALPSVELGAEFVPVSVSVGADSSCVLSQKGQVKCWGHNNSGQLGLGDTNKRGDQPGEMGDALPVVDLEKSVKALAQGPGYYFRCALLESGAVKCWGHNSSGQLGLGDTLNRGDQPGEMGADLPTVKLFSDLW